jgi:hypothetical protein
MEAASKRRRATVPSKEVDTLQLAAQLETVRGIVAGAVAIADRVPIRDDDTMNLIVLVHQLEDRIGEIALLKRARGGDS